MNENVMEVTKVSEYENELWDYKFECPACKEMIFSGNYCSKCGQKISIDRSKIDEMEIIPW